MEVLFISIYPAPNLQQSGRLADISLFCLHGCRLHSCSERPGLAGAWSRRKVLDRLHSVPGIFAPKTKTHRQIASGGGFLELLVMILEYLAPGARRRTHTAGTTEASLLGLLDVGNHLMRVQKRRFEVNVAIAGVLSNRDGGGADPGRKLGGAGQNRTANMDLAEVRSWVSSNRRRRSIQSLKAMGRPLSCIYMC